MDGAFLEDDDVMEEDAVLEEVDAVLVKDDVVLVEVDVVFTWLLTALGQWAFPLIRMIRRVRIK